MDLRTIGWLVGLLLNLVSGALLAPLLMAVVLAEPWLPFALAIAAGVGPAAGRRDGLAPAADPEPDEADRLVRRAAAGTGDPGHADRERRAGALRGAARHRGRDLS